MGGIGESNTSWRGHEAFASNDGTLRKFGVASHDFHKHKAQWLHGLTSRELKDDMMMHHILMDEDYSCPLPQCNAKIKMNSCAPDSSIIGDSKRRAEERKHFGGVP